MWEAAPPDAKATKMSGVDSHGVHNRGKSFVATGTVKWFNEQKGYGFIQPDSGGKDVFVHISAVERSGLRGLAEGQKITFEVGRPPLRQRVGG